MATQRDPRTARGFKLRVVAARSVVAFEPIWAAAWPACAVVGLFLAVSLLGLWQRLPWWLHGVGLVLFIAAFAAALVPLLPMLRWPGREAGLARIEQDSGTRHEPLRALDDQLPAEL